ncbi:MAG: hypothetical protein U0936_27070 [Planctomycetaceae bacterium]
MPRNEHPQSLPGRVVRTTSRAGVGGGAILIGLALFLLFKGLGPGGTGSTGSGTGPQSGKAMISATGTESSSEDAVAAPDEIKGGLTNEEKKSLSSDVFTVLIDEKNFLIELPGFPDPVYREIKLPRVLELAKLVKGDSNGIRVRILRRESARASAEFDLTSGLQKVGVEKDAIIMPADFVP